MLFVFESPDNENAFMDVADTVKEVPIITSNTETLEKQWCPGRLMDSTAPALPRQEASVVPATSGRHNDRNMPFRPLPVGGVPA